MLRTGIVFLTGIVLACYSPLLIDSLWISYLPLLLLVSALNPAFRIVGGLLCGVLWASLAMHWQIDHRWPETLNNKRLVVVGKVINIPRPTSRSIKFLFRPLTLSMPVDYIPDKVKLSWRGAPGNLRPGQLWRLRIKLKQPHGYQNPGGFDYERWLFAQGIQATGHVLRSTDNHLLDDHSFGLNRWRYAINQHIQDSCYGCRHVGLMQALVTGFRGDIPQATRLMLQRSGTAHLIAVSGLHIGIVAAVFYFLGYIGWRRISALQQMAQGDFAMALSWCAGLVYSLLSGLGLPAQRAMMMLTVLLLARLLRLPLNLLQATAAAVLLVLIWSPLAVLSASFWLTLNALLIIVFATLLMQRSDGWFKKLVLLQLLFALLYIPISLIIFQQAHPASFIANLIAVPWVSLVVVPLDFFLLLLFWLPQSVLQWLYQWLDLMLDGLLNFIAWLLDHGLGAIPMAHIAPLWLAVFIVVSVLLLQPGRLISRAILWLLMPLIIFWHPRQPALLRMEVLDVGMGTSIVLQTRHHALIYDFGPGNRRDYSLGRWVVQPFLQYSGIDHVDRIVLSHSDQDHIGGFYALQKDFAEIPAFSGMRDDMLWRFPVLQTIRDCHHSAAWRWDAVRFEFLTTPHRDNDKDNNRSCVLSITVGNTHILLPGDIERLQEQRLLQRYGEHLRANILVAPHHGSMTSSSPSFIRQLAPHSVIFTSGFLNRWRFPRPAIVQRYRALGAQLFNTAQGGAIRVECRETGCRIDSLRHRQPRIWY